MYSLTSAILGGELKIVIKNKHIMASKQDCVTDCGCCFSLSILKSYNATQLYNSRFCHLSIFDDIGSVEDQNRVIL